MKELKSGTVMKIIGIMFSVITGFSMILMPETYSIEPFIQVLIAGTLGGIYMELKEMNKHKTESVNHISEHKHKDIT